MKAKIKIIPGMRFEKLVAIKKVEKTTKTNIINGFACVIVVIPPLYVQVI